MANERHFCAVIAPKAPSAEELERVRSHKAALLLSTKWEPGQDITVQFLDGDPGLQERVKAVAKEWTQAGRARLNLVFVDEGPADIRIAFVQGDGSWSALGTDCHHPDFADGPTMNYGWLTPESPDEEVRSVVLHEFGHALGLIHEHQNPTGGIQWNKPAVYRDLSGDPNYWSKETIDHNMFKAYDPEDLAATPVDPLSIMMYQIPASWTLDGFSADMNNDISVDDEALINRVYK